MPVTAHLSEDTFICPNCGDKNLKQLEVEDKRFQIRNKLTTVQASSIADEDQFLVHACTACGFKWIANEFIASTSQLSSFLLMHFIEKFRQFTPSRFIEAVAWLRRATGKELKNLNENDLLTPNMAKWEFLDELAKFLKRADVDDLVMAFNEISFFSIKDCTQTNVDRHTDQPDLKRSEEQAPSKPQKPLTTTQVLADD